MQRQVDSTDDTFAHDGTSFDFDGPEGPPPAVFLTVPSSTVSRKTSLPLPEKRKRGRQRRAAANSVTSAGSSEEGMSDFRADSSDADRRRPSETNNGESNGKSEGSRTNKRRLASRGSISDESAANNSTAAEVENSPRSGGGRRRGNASTAGSRNSSRLQAGSSKSEATAAEAAAANGGGHQQGETAAAGKRVRKPTPRALAFVSATDSMDQDAPDRSDDDDNGGASGDNQAGSRSSKGGRGRSTSSGSGTSKRPVRAAAARGSDNNSGGGGAGATTSANASASSAGAQGSGRTEEAKDRNREHARKTRLRKKEYVASLQAELSEVSRLHAAEVARRDLANQPNAGQKGLATAILNRFLRWRGGHEDLRYDEMLDVAAPSSSSSSTAAGSTSSQSLPPEGLQEATRESRHNSRSGGVNDASAAPPPRARSTGRATIADMLHPNFALELPVTPYRSPPCPEAATAPGASGSLSADDHEGITVRIAGRGGKGGLGLGGGPARLQPPSHAAGVHVLSGLSGAEQDRASLRLLGESLGRGSAQWNDAMANPGLDTCRRGTGARWHFLPLDPSMVSWQEKQSMHDYNHAYGSSPFGDANTVPDDVVFGDFGDEEGESDFMKGRGTPPFPYPSTSSTSTTSTTSTTTTEKNKHSSSSGGATWVEAGTLMACWESVSLGAKVQGAANEVTCRGMLAATFAMRRDDGAKTGERTKPGVYGEAGDEHAEVVGDEDEDAEKQALLSSLLSPSLATFKLLKLELCFDAMAAMHALQGTVPSNLRYHQPNPPPPLPPPSAPAAAAAAPASVSLSSAQQQPLAEGRGAEHSNNEAVAAHKQAPSSSVGKDGQQPPSSWALRQFLESQARPPPSSSTTSSHGHGSSSHSNSVSRNEHDSSGGSGGTGSGGSSPQDGLPHLVSENGSERSFRAPSSTGHNPRQARSYSNASSGWHNSNSSSGGGGDSPDCESALGSPTSPNSDAPSGSVNPSSSLTVTSSTSSSLSVTSSVQTTSSNTAAIAAVRSQAGGPPGPSQARSRLVVPPVPVTLAEAWEAYGMQEESSDKVVVDSTTTAIHHDGHLHAQRANTVIRPPPSSLSLSLPQAAVVVSATPPFRVMATNAAWAQLTHGHQPTSGHGAHVADLFRPLQQEHHHHNGDDASASSRLGAPRSGSGINFNAPRRADPQSRSASNHNSSSASVVLAVAASGSERTMTLESLLVQAAQGTASSGLVLGPPSLPAANHGHSASSAAFHSNSSSGALPACAGKYYLRASGLAQGISSNGNSNGNIGSGGGGEAGGGRGVTHLLLLIDAVAHVPASALPPHAAAAFLSTHQASHTVPPATTTSSAAAHATGSSELILAGNAIKATVCAPWRWILPALTPSQEVNLLWGPLAAPPAAHGSAVHTNGGMPHEMSEASLHGHSGHSSSHHEYPNHNPNGNGDRQVHHSAEISNISAAAAHDPRAINQDPHRGRFTWAAAAARTAVGKSFERTADKFQHQHQPRASSRGAKFGSSRAVSMDGYLNAEGWPESGESNNSKSSSRGATANKRKGTTNAVTATTTITTTTTSSRVGKAANQRAGLSVAAARATSTASGGNTANASKKHPPKLTHAATDGFLFGLDFGFGAASPVGLFDGVVVGGHGSVAEDAGSIGSGGSGSSGGLNNNNNYGFNDDGGVSPASALGLRPQVPLDPSNGNNSTFPGPEVNNSDVFGMGTPTAGASEFLNWGL